jgi:hypothetical protein
MKKILLSVILALPFAIMAQTINVSNVQLLSDADGNGYIDPNEVITLSLTLTNNSGIQHQNFSIEENITYYQAEFISLAFAQSYLQPGDSMVVDVTYLTDEDLQPWDFDASLVFIDESGTDSTVLDFTVPMVFHFECSELDLISVQVYTESTYPGIEVLFENNSSWDLQYPGILFSTNDPYVQFPGNVGYYYVLPNDFTYPMWESITVSPYTPENYTVNATVTFITIDSTVICDFPISFVLNQTSVSISTYQKDEQFLHPNPATDWIELSGISYSTTEAMILAMDGRIVHTDYLESGQNKINIQSLGSGMYYIEIRNKERTTLLSRQLFVKQ